MAETTGTRRAGRTVGSAALTVTVGVAVNQILNDDKFSWTWLYVSLAVAVLAFLYSESVPRARAGDGRGSRRVYLRQLRADVRDMETVGIATHGEFVLRTHQVYVDVSLAPQTVQATAGAPYLGAVSEQETAPGRRRSLESVLRDAEEGTAARILAVVGGPGSGKTTLARSTALSLCERGRRPWARRLPVLLYLRDHAATLLADEPPHLAQVAVSAGWLEGKVSAGWLERRLDAGRCVVLLDGLDEVADPAERGRVAAWVTRQTQRHPDNVYVVTSRPHGYQTNPLPGAEVLQVRRFTGDQISRYLHQWHYAMESRARALTRRAARAATDGPLARLRTRADTDRHVRAAADRGARDLLARLRAESALYDLASNPLLLTMIANVHRYRGELPGTRAGLYAEMCDVLLHRRYEDRGLRDATGLSGPHKQHVIQHLALAMMRARVRDWPAADAARAIRRPLRHVPGSVPPELFLAEARKSGLLVERDHGFYGFAHLTLQEYLAAALLSTPRADTGLLTGNIGDPWWRETVLLWCAGNDATDVITACLDTGTVPALALAADCADQAGTVDPAVRARLETRLSPPALGEPHDPSRERLLAGIHATRFLRDTVPLGESAALCLRPVPRVLYDCFVRQEETDGRHHPSRPDTTGSGAHANGGGTDDGPTVATGMLSGDAERFVAWLGSVTAGLVHRLPMPAELPLRVDPDDAEVHPEPSAGLAAFVNRHTVWVRDGTETVLLRPPGVPWPFRPPAERVRAAPAADLGEAARHLRLLFTHRREDVGWENWAGVLATALALASESPGTPATEPWAPVLALAVAHAAARARAAGTAAAPSAVPYVEDLVALLTSDSADDPARDWTDLADRAHDRARDIARALGEATHIPRIHALEEALAVATALAGHLARAASYGRTLGPARDRLARTPSEPHEITAALVVALGVPADPLPTEVRFPALDLAHARDPGLAARLAAELGGPGDDDTLLADALDETLDLALGAHTGTLDVVLTAFRTLLGVPPWPGAEGPVVLRNLGIFMQDVGGQSLDSESPVDPAATLRRIGILLRSDPPDVPPGLLDDLRLLVRQSLGLVTSLRDRRPHFGPRTPACIRFAVLAAFTALRLVDRGHHPAARLLHLAWQSLIAHDPPTGAGVADPNQILVIVRDDAPPAENANVRAAGA
ncbi:NACHT domain-containing protein [Streptomyces sp. NPDC086023]|uniref:NACHT domain-containing protein n=1 Tax=Streptomyces sp. NPDC086023 TaxID=3365746 RepID=UPI0037D8563D